MTRVDESADTGAAGQPKTANPATLPLVLAIAAIIAPVFYFLFFPLIGLTAVGAVFAIVLVIRARRSGHRGTALGLALILSVIGAVVDIVVLIAITIAITGPSLSRVEIQATGGPTFAVEYSVGTDDYSDEWQSDGFKKFSTPGSTAEITVTPSPDGTAFPHSCRILWNEIIVAEESSDTGPVTCSYDEG